MATDANTLLADTACYECLGEAEWRMIQLGLLQQILLANNPMADTSANTLLEATKCYKCLGEAEWRMIELGLLQQIVDGGGGGGGGTGGVVCFTGADPVAAPTNACTLAYRTDNGALWKWNGAAWDQLLGP